MLRSLFGRRSRSTWVRLIYLCLVTVVFLFVTSHFNSVKLDARVIPEEIPVQHEIVIERIREPVEHEKEWQVIQPNKFQKPTKTVYINNEKYPKLNSNGKVIAQRRIVHLDLKGAPYKPHFFVELFSFFNRLQATGIIIEWEDMFPYQGKLRNATNKYAYSIQDIEMILGEAKKRNLQIIPLVQTMGHLEWILKLEQFAHLREDPKFPQVICFAASEAWELIEEMIKEVGEIHKKYGMEYFHIGADEAFQIGFCRENIIRMEKEISRERLMLWHIARTAKYVKNTFENVEVLAWHDMLVNGMENDIRDYKLTELIQPVLWNYAEDLDMYLPRTTWMLLRSFKRVWGSSAWKGADGPARYSTHSEHYIKNHESWINQFSMVYQDFEAIEGLIMTGWSRYDHLAVLAELGPIGLPTLAMSMETILEGRQLRGDYPVTSELLQCTPPIDNGYSATGCRFPGSRIYEIVNDLYQKRRQLKAYRDDDYELNGWMSRLSDEYSVSSHWYIDKIQPMIEMYGVPLEQIEKDLRFEMSKIFYQDTIDEFIFTYIGEDLDWIRRKRKTMQRISELRNFPIRPFFDEKHRITEKSIFRWNHLFSENLVRNDGNNNNYNFRAWMLIALVGGVLLIMIVIVCCFMKIRIPRTKRQIDLIAAKRKLRKSNKKSEANAQNEERAQAIVMNSMRPTKSSDSSRPSGSRIQSQV
ncbi:unnamed protein product [Caenorhabditis angaria]|uniref:beta-N-acetylhexosaminidase n=1 Tax=Caenorhabditis angaria TaxID=860376 RepID=A0A9P1IKE1_9PELO|nr:unnamed protein product [Caenorhabditis angaria]